jgi:hypothetical protein
LSKDSDIGEGSGTLNPYIYCDNNPVMKIDSNGRQAAWALGGLFGAGALAGLAPFAPWIIGAAIGVGIIAGTVILVQHYYTNSRGGVTPRVINYSLPEIKSVPQNAWQKSASGTSSYHRRSITSVKSVVVAPPIDTSYYDAIKATTILLATSSLLLYDKWGKVDWKAKSRTETKGELWTKKSDTAKGGVYYAHVMEFTGGETGGALVTFTPSYGRMPFRPFGSYSSATSYLAGQGFRRTPC